MATSSDDLLDQIWEMQSKRMDSQRAELIPEEGAAGAASATGATGAATAGGSTTEDEEAFFDMLMRCQVYLVVMVTVAMETKKKLK